MFASVTPIRSQISHATFSFLLLNLLQGCIWNLVHNTVRQFPPVCPYCFSATVPCHHFHADGVKITVIFTANNIRLQNVTAFPFQILELWMDFHQLFPAVAIVLSSWIILQLHLKTLKVYSKIHDSMILQKRSPSYVLKDLSHKLPFHFLIVDHFLQ